MTPRRNLVIMLLIMLVAGLFSANAETESSSDGQKSCVIDTTTDQSTGRPRTSGTGVQVCTEGGQTTVGIDTTGQEVGHFFEYPLGQSDHSVLRQGADAIGSGIKTLFGGHGGGNNFMQEREQQRAAWLGHHG